MRADRAGHRLLDHVEPRVRLGLAALLLHPAVCLQLRHGRPLRRQSGDGHVGGQLLVHHAVDRHHPDGAGDGVAVLLRGPVPHTGRSGAEETAGGQGPQAATGPVPEDAVGAQAGPLRALWLRVRSPGGLRPADHVRENDAEAAAADLVVHVLSGSVRRQLASSGYSGVLLRDGGQRRSRGQVIERGLGRRPADRG